MISRSRTSLSTVSSLLGLAIVLHACQDPDQHSDTPPAKPAAKVETVEPKPAPPPSPKTTGQDKSGKSPAPPSDLLTYPRDKDRLMATVNGRKITLGDIIDHIDDRHFTGFKTLLSIRSGQLELRIPRMADWVRQYADLLALRAEARKRGIKETAIKANMGAVYERSFVRYQQDYVDRTKRPFPSTEQGFNAMRQRFQKSRGIGMEVEGLLNTLVPDKLDRTEVTQFYKDYNESMNGLLKIAQIFVKNRDPKTGARFTGERMKAVKARVREISRRLEAEGSKFEAIAAEFSEDRASASRGGVLDNLNRFDPNMPARFCNTAWNLRNGQWTGPFETRWGIHFVKRISWTITSMIIRPDPDNRDVRRFVRTHRKEAMLFDVRKRHQVTLHY